MSKDLRPLGNSWAGTEACGNHVKGFGSRFFSGDRPGDKRLLNYPAKPLLVPDPQKLCKVLNICCLNLFSFGVLSDAATWN